MLYQLSYASLRDRLARYRRTTSFMSFRMPGTIYKVITADVHVQAGASECGRNSQTSPHGANVPIISNRGGYFAWPRYPLGRFDPKLEVQRAIRHPKRRACLPPRNLDSRVTPTVANRHLLP